MGGMVIPLFLAAVVVAPIDTATRAPHFKWLDQARREQARIAVAKGIDCILKMQVATKTNFDVVVVQDEKAPPLLPRMVEIGTDRALFADREGVVAYSLAEIDRERRTGSGWFGSWPRQLIETDYPQWRARVK